jgi:hypothetical protein
MRQRLFIFVSLAVVVIALIAMNAATYVEIEREPDAEWNPDRSTFNAGATGTRALYDFLSESGYQTMRWRESANGLTKSGNVKPGVFVVIGALKLPFKDDEREALRAWVKNGGRLVLIDRKPAWDLLPAADGLQVSTKLKQFPAQDTKPENIEDMTKGVTPVKPAQPTLLTRNVEAVQPSRFASRISFLPPDKPATKAKSAPSPTPEESGEDAEIVEEEEPPPLKPANPPPAQALETKSAAPVIHLADAKEGPLVVDYVYGQGRIVLLSDPFIVANSGLRSADNLQLALNLVAGGEGVIAFDEYHQNRARAQNELLAYFSGTPIIALLAQGGLLAALFIWARGRRFGRALPLAQVDRRSKLEFVASMAELQQRARAYDLALENIYTRTRRALARYAGLSADSPRAAVAANVAARSGLDAAALETLMCDCEDHINGEPLKPLRALDLIARLRDIESQLGLNTGQREGRRQN